MFKDNQTEGADDGADSTAEAAAAVPRWPLYTMLVASMALWGGTWPVGRVLAQSLAPWNAALLRFLLATAALVLICFGTEGARVFRVRRGLIPSLFLLGATGIFGYSFLFFSGLKTIGAGRAGLIVGCIPVCIALCSALIARRGIPLLSGAGILLSLVGVAVVISNGDPAVLLRGTVQRGDLMILGCVVCWTAYTLIARPVMKELTPLSALTWSCIFGTLLILPFSLYGGLWQDVTDAGWSDWAGLIYLGVLATSLAYYCYYHAIHHVGTVAAGIFINLVPLFAVLLGCVFLDETLRLWQVFGGVMIITGVVITVRTGQTRRAGTGDSAAAPPRSPTVNSTPSGTEGSCARQA